jgi:hypothetical protein
LSIPKNIDNNNKQQNMNKKTITLALILLFFAPSVFARCAGNGEIFTVKEGISACIEPGVGHKIIHCQVSGLQQNAYLLISHTNFVADSLYHLPKEAIHINDNNQRIVFSGLGISKDSEIIFHYFGPWDPSYQFDMTCSW